LSVIRAWAINIACGLFQIALIGFLGIAVFYIGGYILEGLIWAVTGNAKLGLTLGPIFSTIISIFFYAIGWYGFWNMLYHDGRKQWFYTRVAFGLIPLIALLCIFRPSPPDPMSMQLVNISNQFIFSTEVTAIILFPLYSIGLYRYVLPIGIKNSLKNFIFVCLIMLIIGSVIYPIAWNTMQIIYK
jgi:hypothetical protein